MTRVFILAGLPAAAGAETPVVFPEVTDVMHAGLIRGWDDAAFERGRDGEDARSGVMKAGTDAQQDMGLTLRLEVLFGEIA